MVFLEGSLVIGAARFVGKAMFDWVSDFGKKKPRIPGMGADAAITPGINGEMPPTGAQPLPRPAAPPMQQQPAPQAAAPSAEYSMKDDWSPNPMPTAQTQAPMVRLSRPEQTMPQPVSASTQMGDIPAQVPRASVPMAPPMPQVPNGMNKSDYAGIDRTVALPRPQMISPYIDQRPDEIAPPRLSRPSTNESRVGVPIPQLPGHKGDPMPYTPYEDARYQTVMEGHRDAEGNISHRNDAGNFVDNKPQGVGWKEGFKSAALGAARAYQANPQGGLAALAGGAIGGGIGAKLNPDAARGANFDAGQGRQMIAQQQRRDQEIARQAQIQKLGLENEHLKAQTGLYGAQAENLKTDNALAGDKFKFDQEQKRNQQAIEIYKIKHPGRNPYQDKDGFARDPVTHEVVTDPQTGQPIQLPPPASMQERPMNVGPQGAVYDPKTRQEIYRNPGSEKQDAHYASGVENTLKEHADLKSKATAADAAYKVAQSTLAKDPKNPDIQAATDKALAHREATLQALNSHAQGVNETYGDQLEGGIGAGGFGYVRRKAGAKPLARGGSSGGTAPLSEFNSSKYPGWTP